MLTGPEAVYNNRWGVSGSGAANGPESFKCRCIQEPINCEPDDGYDVSRKFRCRNFDRYLVVIQYAVLSHYCKEIFCENSNIGGFLWSS